MTIVLSGVDTKSVQEATYEVETRVGEIAGKGIQRRKPYNISFQIRFIVSHEEIK